MINERLKKIRIDSGMSQKEFGERLHLSQTHIASCENGKRTLTGRVAKDICRSFNVNFDWLMEGNPPEYKNPLVGLDIEEDVKQLAAQYNLLSDSDKELVKGLVNSLNGKAKHN